MVSFGFHSGPNGNLNGIGDHWRAMDTARIPAFLKSADYYGPAFELANIAAASGVPHTVIYRLSTRGQNNGIQYDVPDYSLSPIAAAGKHWTNTRAKLPPEFDKSRVWVEPINECDQERADWLGQFAVELAKLANGQGYKVTLFGWSSGEPEPTDWSMPGMLAYLRYCAANPGKAAVSLHEYSFDVDDILDGYPYKIGRFMQLLTVCQQNNIAPPEIHLTEWGWTYRNVPTPDMAMADLETVYDVYAPYPTVKGAAIWNLGGGPEWGDIHNQTQRLIAPVTQFNIDHAGEVPPPQPPTLPKIVILKKPAKAEITKAENDAANTFAWDNYGRTTTHSIDDMIRMLSGGNADSYAILAYPDRASQNEARLALQAGDYRWVEWPEVVPPPTNPQIQVTPISQRDPRWASVDMGGEGKTLGNFGCLLVAYLIHAKHWKLCNDDPPAFMTRLKAAGAMSGPYLLPAALRTAFPDRVKYLGYETRSVLLDARIKASIDRGIPVPARVDFTPATGQFEQHWVLITGYTASDFIMSDPWRGDIATVSSRYNITGNDVLEGIFYELLPVQPPATTIDLRRFIVADPACWRVVRMPDGRQEDIQDMQLPGGMFVRRKNNLGEWWRADGQFFYLVHDTSPDKDSQGNERVYTLTKNGVPGAPMIPLALAVNQSWQESGSHHVQFKAKNDCRPLSENSGAAQNSVTLVRYEKNFTFNRYGQVLTFDEVIWLKHKTETQIYGRKDGKPCGWLGWVAPWGESEPVEIYWNRPPMITEPPRYCL